MGALHPDRLHSAVVAICPEVRSRIENFVSQQLTEERLWREATCCILSSQVPYEMADAYACGFNHADIEKWVESSTEVSRQLIFEFLRQPILVNGHPRRYRFPNVGASRIAASLNNFRSKGLSLSTLVYSDESPQTKRDKIISEVQGFGPKQASMFLRNIGVTFDLAILDRHVVRYMGAVGLVPNDMQPCSTINRYKKLEGIMHDYAQEIGFSIGCVDWAIWIVMGVAGGRRQ